MKKISILALLPMIFLTGCGFWRIDTMSYLIRSDVITSPDEENKILSKASLGYTDDGKIRVLYTSGTPYEIGYQHGVLLRKEINDNIKSLYDSAVDKFHVEELFDEVYERMRPYMKKEYVEEMHGLAHGSRLPLKVIHGIHILPEIGEWGGKKRIGKIVKQMMRGELGTSCSNMAALPKATKDNKMYVVRILDWGLHRISKLHKYPLIHVSKPNYGKPYVNIGWVGFLGAISGMNSEGITLGEMGYGDGPNETLRGNPMPFLLREVLSHAKNLKDVQRIIKTNEGTNAFIYLMADGKAKKAEIYIRDRDRFRVFNEGASISDKRTTMDGQIKESNVTGIKDYVYGGHYNDKMYEQLSTNKGEITPEVLMKKVIPQISMPSNFQNVIYSPQTLEFWVANAKSKDDRAAESEYSYFNFEKALN